MDIIMKKKITALAAAFAVLTGAVEASAITFSGTAVGRSGYVTAMTLKTGADRTNPQTSEIGWIGQSKVENGHYSIDIPESQFTGEYDILSNECLTRHIYVSSDGSDSGTGKIDLPFKTITAALAEAVSGDTVVLLDTITVPKNAQLVCGGNITLTGKNPVTGEVTGGIDMTSTVSMHIKFSGTIENMSLTTIEAPTISQSANKIFACGNRLVFGEGLTMSNPIDIFGGHSVNNSVNSTDIYVKSGTYRRIYGGGENSPVTGDTNVTIYSMNTQYSANDDAAAYYDSRIFGGGKNGGADVGGDTHINFCGGTAAYLVGSGSGAGVSGDTNISISGGRVMNVYGGTIDKSTVHTGNSFIEMTGGMAESLFGGSMSCSFTGNTNINVTGGEILRRIYGGCYNDWGFSWAGTEHVSGMTTVAVGGSAKIATGGDLSSMNKLNSGIFGGSRCEENYSEESAAVIFANGTYEKLGAKLGEQSSGYKNDFLSHHDYIIKVGTGGRIERSGTDTLQLYPNKGRSAAVNGRKNFTGSARITAGETEIAFENGFTIDIKTLTEAIDRSIVNAYVTVGDSAKPDGNAELIAAISDSDGTLIGIQKAKITDSGNYEFELPPPRGSGCTVRLYIWNMETLTPAGGACTLNFSGGL